MDDVINSKYYKLPKSKCSHCSSPIELIDIARYMDFNLGSAFKYIWRADHKGKPVEDLVKARWHLDNEIKLRENS